MLNAQSGSSLPGRPSHRHEYCTSDLVSAVVLTLENAWTICEPMRILVHPWRLICMFATAPEAPRARTVVASTRWPTLLWFTPFPKVVFCAQVTAPTAMTQGRDHCGRAAPCGRFATACTEPPLSALAGVIPTSSCHLYIVSPRKHTGFRGGIPVSRSCLRVCGKRSTRHNPMPSDPCSWDGASPTLI